MTDNSSRLEAQLQARLSVLELVVGMMIREDVLKSGKGPADILAFGENVKKVLGNRTPTDPSDEYLSDAADKFFSAIASDAGSRDSLEPS